MLENQLPLKVLKVLIDVESGQAGARTVRVWNHVNFDFPKFRNLEKLQFMGKDESNHCYHLAHIYFTNTATIHCFTVSFRKSVKSVVLFL